MLLKSLCLMNNWSFPSSKNSHFQDEVRCKTVLVKIMFYLRSASI